MRLLDIATYFTSDPAIGAELDDDALRTLHVGPEPSDSPWVRANFVSSIDGSVTAGGLSGGLGTPSDSRLFSVLRELSDVVLVGAGTVRAENYGGVTMSADARKRRAARGLAPVPTIVVVTASASLDADLRLFVDTEVQPIVLTSSAADASNVSSLRSAGAQVIEVPGTTVSTRAILDSLTDLGFRHVLCEGGPGLFGQLLGDDAIDELCLTLSPMLVGGAAGRISHGASAADTPMRRAHVLGDDDGTLLTRWVRSRDDGRQVDSLAR